MYSTAITAESLSKFMIEPSLLSAGRTLRTNESIRVMTDSAVSTAKNSVPRRVCAISVKGAQPGNANNSLPSYIRYASSPTAVILTPAIVTRIRIYPIQHITATTSSAISSTLNATVRPFLYDRREQKTTAATSSSTIGTAVHTVYIIPMVSKSYKNISIKIII